MFLLVRRARLKKPYQSSGTMMEQGKLGHRSNRGKKHQTSPEYTRYDLKQAMAVGAGRKAKRNMQKVESERKMHFDSGDSM